MGDTPRRSRRPQRRELCCPAHPEQRIEANGKKYFLHLVTSQQIKARGMADKKAKLVIQAYPVLVLSNEWLEELFCPSCGTRRWCHVTKHDRVAHVDPVGANPTVSEYTRREARRHSQQRADGKRVFDPG